MEGGRRSPSCLSLLPPLFGLIVLAAERVLHAAAPDVADDRSGDVQADVGAAAQRACRIGGRVAIHDEPRLARGGEQVVHLSGDLGAGAQLAPAAVRGDLPGQPSRSRPPRDRFHLGWLRRCCSLSPPPS
eukprot:6291389-Pyramimonas_sp.AAC.1